MDGTLQIYRNDDVIVESNGTEMPVFDEDNSISVVNSGETLEFSVKVNGMEDNSGFLVSSDVEWATIIRNRNEVKVIVKPNYDISPRECNITFTHNIAQDVMCVVYITQDAEVYDIKICDGNNCDVEEIKFPLIGKSEKTLTVNCTGGTGKFGVFKPRKFVTVKVDKVNENDEDFVYDKRVVFDGAISVATEQNTITLTTDGTLSTHYNDDVTEVDGVETHNYTYNNDCYYVVTVSHSDIIGVTDSVKISFTDSDDCELPELNAESTPNDVHCEPIELLQPKIHDTGEEEIIPSIEFVDERDSDIIITSEDFTYIEVETVPVESLVYFRYYGNFISDVTITHDGTKSTIGIKAKPNQYPFERSCLGYVINAEYPDERIKVIMTQEGNV